MHCLCFEGSPWSLTKMHNQHYWILLICEGYLPPPLSPHVLLTHLCAVHWVGGVVAHGSWPQMLTTLKDRSWFDPANGAKHDWHCLTHLDTSWHILTHLDTSWHTLTHLDRLFYIIVMSLPAAFRTLFGVEAFLSDGVQIGRPFLARLKLWQD